jgi:hypothetical protein
MGPLIVEQRGRRPTSGGQAPSEGLIPERQVGAAVGSLRGGRHRPWSDGLARLWAERGDDKSRAWKKKIVLGIAIVVSAIMWLAIGYATWATLHSMFQQH